MMKWSKNGVDVICLFWSSKLRKDAYRKTYYNAQHYTYHMQHNERLQYQKKIITECWAAWALLMSNIKYNITTSIFMRDADRNL
jgi:hypothetical protein